MHTFYITFYYWVKKNKALSIAMGAVLLCAGLFFGSKLSYNEDISQIIPKSDKSDLTAKVLSQMNFSDNIVVIIENRSPKNTFELSETADEFLNQIEPIQTKYIQSVQGKIGEDDISETFDFVAQNIPLFLDDSDYQTIKKQLKPDSVSARLKKNYEALVSPTSLITKDFIKKDPLGITALGMEKLASVGTGEDFHLENNYITTKDGQHLLLFINPKLAGNETKNNEVFVEKLNEIKDKINAKFKGKTQLSYFGSSFIAVANAKQIKHDIQSTVAISSVLLLILLMYYFRNFLMPVIIFLPTVFAAVVTLGLLYFIKPQVSAISLSVSAILIGITIDYALHILTHYKHNANIEAVYREITAPIMLSAITTSVSFLCLVFVKSEALKDLGIFAAIAVMLAAVFSLLLIPHIYKPGKNVRKQNTIIDKIGAYPYEKNKILAVVCLAVIVVSFFGFNKVKFDHNISNLNFVPEDMKTSEAKLEKISDITSKSVYVVAFGKDQESVLENNSKIAKTLALDKQKGNILSYQSVGNVVLSRANQAEKIKKWNRFWSQNQAQKTISELKIEGAKTGFNSAAFLETENQLNKNYRPISLKDYRNLKPLQWTEFTTQKDGFFTMTTMVKLDETKRNQLIKTVEKNKNVLAIDRQQISENFLGLLKNDFSQLINYSLLAVIIIFYLFFRNKDLTFFAIIPIILSGIVTAGILYFLNLKLNIFSTIVCTLVFGAGVDFNIFLTQALQKQHTNGKNELAVYRVSIILALLTTILAIGALIFAKHPALHSVALVALVGMFAVVLISFTLYPLLFNFIIKRGKKGLSPITFRLFFHSMLSFAYYGLGGFLFSFIGHFFIQKAKGKQLLFFKNVISKFLTSVLYSDPFVKKKIENPHQEIFEKPAVIIANHTSFLDTLVISMVTPKLIFLVNDWVWESPIFGKLVKALGFFPVSQGIENGINPLKQKIEQGYSPMVFPEATRSMDNRVRRFHKGAFYLAQEFELDILPIYIHGNSEVLPKGDYIIYDGAITAVVGKRIEYTDASFGSQYSQRTKKINSHYRQEFQDIRDRLEDEDYFRKLLFLSYLYKENAVVNSVKEDFNTYKNLYFRLNQFLKPDEKILHWANDFGQIDFILTLQQAGRTIFSWIEEEEKRLVAQNNYLVNRREIHHIQDFSETKNVETLLISHGLPVDFQLPYSIKKIIVVKDIHLHLPSDFAEFGQESGIKIYTRS